MSNTTDFRRASRTVVMSPDAVVADMARDEGVKSLILLVGIPASGKSTFADRLVAKGYVRLSMDAIRGELFGDEGIFGDEAQQRQVRETFRKRLTDELAAGKRVLVDNTNFSEAARRAALKAGETAGYTDVQLLILDVPLEECLRRNRERARHVDEQVIRMMHGQLHGQGWPKITEGRRIVAKPGKTRDEFRVKHLAVRDKV